jgi:hypothetical protein
MKRKSSMVPVLLVTFYLIVYSIITYLQISISLTFLMYATSPFLIVWMVISVLKGGMNDKKVLELKEKEEWGYQDMNKDDLRVF